MYSIMTDNIPHQVMNLADEARALMRSCPLIGMLSPCIYGSRGYTYTHLDGHNDFPYMIRGWNCNDMKAELENMPIGQTDLVRLGESGLGGQFWSAFVPR